MNSKVEDLPLESVFETLGVEFTVINLNWSPEEEPDWYPDDEEEIDDAEEDEPEDKREQMDPYQVLLHTLATMSMSTIEGLDHDEPFEKVQWDEELTQRNLCIVPTQIHPIATGSGMYLRFWGYLCEFDPETESVSARRVTMSLPSRLRKRMGADPESFSMKADPVDDAVVFMIITQYYGREEFEIDGQKLSAHKFGETVLIEGRWSED
jgi:hypothetical protein